MPDICVLYARKDAQRIPKALEKLFNGRWIVWWDKKIPSGDYRKAILAAIESSACIIPIWSDAAPESAVMHDELTYAKGLGRCIMPLRIHQVKAPLGFGTLQATDILHWNGSSSTPGALEFRDKVCAEIIKTRPKSRPATHPNFPTLPMPAFFFSVSSHETRLTPARAMKALSVFGAHTVLLSAYDFKDEDQAKTLRSKAGKIIATGGVVLLDSGNYEKSRLGDESWKASRFWQVLKKTPHSLAFAFDSIKPPKSFRSTVSNAVEAAQETAKHTSKPVIPILHLPRDSEGAHQTVLAPQAAKEIARATDPAFLAIPERELGSCLFARVEAMKAIRQQLGDLPRYIPVHILGTGSPVSIALLSAAGADSFDGLEWCRFVVDGTSKTLHHFSHYDLFRWQDEWASSQVTRDARLAKGISNTGKTIFHNLDFYTGWMECELRPSLLKDSLRGEFFTKLLSQQGMKEGMRDARATLGDLL